jgi:hypothetical protein
MTQEKNFLKKFLRLLEKYDLDKENKHLVLEQLNIILNMNYNIKPNISAEHYKKIYPQFNEKVHRLLNRCAKEKRQDFRKNKFEKINKSIIINFN